MEQTKISLLFLALIVRLCIAQVDVQTAKPAESTKLVEAAVKILTSCYGNKQNAIGIVGKLPQTFITRLWDHQLIPVVLIDNTTRIMQRDLTLLPSRGRTKLHVFVIIASTRQEIYHRIAQLWHSPWHNHMASFLILDWSPRAKYGCKQIEQKLFSLWRLKIYNANVICLPPTYRTAIIFGYNPHTNQAPKPWKLSRTLQKKPQGFFTVFWREQREGPEMCTNLNFDKTIDLSGEVIDCLHRPYKYLKKKQLSRQRLRRTGKRHVNLLTTFIRQVNATIKMRMWISKGNEVFTIKHVQDILAQPLYYGELLQFRKTYPIGQTGQLIMTRYRGDMTQLSKILGVIDSKSQIGLCLVLLITVMFFKIVVHQALVPAILNVLRITCNMSFMNLPRNMSSRTYLACLLFFAVTMQGIFTGNLATLLTIQIPLRHPNTAQDLIDMDYTIYTWSANIPYFTDPMFEERIVEVPGIGDCSEIALRDPWIACVGTDYILKDAADADHNLYVSSDPVIKHYHGFITAMNWPFLKRMNKILSIMAEADIRDPFYMRVILKRLSDKNSEEMNNHGPKVMTLTNLRFAFVILGIGLGFATISFIVEIAINKKRSNVLKVRRNV